jgi:hypothetical protein
VRPTAPLNGKRGDTLKCGNPLKWEMEGCIEMRHCNGYLRGGEVHWNASRALEFGRYNQMAMPGLFHATLEWTYTDSSCGFARKSQLFLALQEEGESNHKNVNTPQGNKECFLGVFRHVMESTFLSHIERGIEHVTSRCQIHN